MNPLLALSVEAKHSVNHGLEMGTTSPFQKTAMQEKQCSVELYDSGD